MFARVSTFQYQRGALDELVKLFNESIIPANRARSGHLRTYFLVDAAAEQAMVISVWESQEALAAGDHDGFYQAQLGKVQHLLASGVARHIYELKAQS
ncbi:MAG: antibiotic biosynthesis monooxygenase [Anaerolineae bacterium]|nr:antibiotic biosynthesis monooxygenase [Anaerolineae bacterium]MDW8300053.1 antibiotic biosynthesis monooxygenase [Anaerolineae bacterium]